MAWADRESMVNDATMASDMGAISIGITPAESEVLTTTTAQVFTQVGETDEGGDDGEYDRRTVSVLIKQSDYSADPNGATLTIGSDTYIVYSATDNNGLWGVQAELVSANNRMVDGGKAVTP